MASLALSSSAPSRRHLFSPSSSSSSSFHRHPKSGPRLPDRGVFGNDATVQNYLNSTQLQELAGGRGGHTRLRVFSGRANPLLVQRWWRSNDVWSYALFHYSSRRLATDQTLMPTTITCLSSNDDESSTIIWSTQLVQKEYADLCLSLTSGDIGHVRLRQHVNPFSISLSVPAQVPRWEEVFHDPTLPLMVDIGSGSGRFLIWLANKSPDSNNYLGLEIRQKLVKRANFWARELSLRNIYFMFANAIISFEHLVATYPGPVTLVSVLFPDPYFKKRHRKRRVLQKPLVDSILKHLSPGGKVFVQSDICEVAIEMRTQFDALSDMFEHADVANPNILCDSEGWLLCNPMGIRTEREIHAESGGAKIYRRLYIKRAHMLC